MVAIKPSFKLMLVTLNLVALLALQATPALAEGRDGAQVDSAIRRHASRNGRMAKRFPPSSASSGQKPALNKRERHHNHNIYGLTPEEINELLNEEDVEDTGIYVPPSNGTTYTRHRNHTSTSSADDSQPTTFHRFAGSNSTTSDRNATLSDSDNSSGNTTSSSYGATSTPTHHHSYTPLWNETSASNSSSDESETPSRNSTISSIPSASSSSSSDESANSPEAAHTSSSSSGNSTDNTSSNNNEGLGGLLSTLLKPSSTSSSHISQPTATNQTESSSTSSSSVSQSSQEDGGDSSPVSSSRHSATSQPDFYSFTPQPTNSSTSAQPAATSSSGLLGQLLGNPKSATPTGSSSTATPTVAPSNGIASSHNGSSSATSDSVNGTEGSGSQSTTDDAQSDSSTTSAKGTSPTNSASPDGTPSGNTATTTTDASGNTTGITATVSNGSGSGSGSSTTTTNDNGSGSSATATAGSGGSAVPTANPSTTTQTNGPAPTGSNTSNANSGGSGSSAVQSSASGSASSAYPQPSSSSSTSDADSGSSSSTWDSSSSSSSTTATTNPYWYANTQSLNLAPSSTSSAAAPASTSTSTDDGLTDSSTLTSSTSSVGGGSGPSVQDLPTTIVPSADSYDQPANTTSIGLLFKQDMKWTWVISQADLTAQIFAFMPDLLGQPVSLESSKISTVKLAGYSTETNTTANTNTLPNARTLYMAYVPSSSVEDIQAMIANTSSPFYTAAAAGAPQQLASQVDSTFNILSVAGQVAAGSKQRSTSGSGSSGDDNKLRNSLIGVGCGLAGAFAAVVGGMMWRKKHNEKKEGGVGNAGGVSRAHTIRSFSGGLRETWAPDALQQGVAGDMQQVWSAHDGAMFAPAQPMSAANAHGDGFGGYVAADPFVDSAYRQQEQGAYVNMNRSSRMTERSAYSDLSQMTEAQRIQYDYESSRRSFHSTSDHGSGSGSSQSHGAVSNESMGMASTYQEDYRVPRQQTGSHAFGTRPPSQQGQGRSRRRGSVASSIIGRPEMQSNSVLL